MKMKGPLGGPSSGCSTWHLPWFDLVSDWDEGVFRQLFKRFSNSVRQSLSKLKFSLSDRAVDVVSNL